MCKCSTILEIMELTNKIRRRSGLKPLPYVYVLKGWHNLVDNYEGKRNPYHATRKIGLNYVFSRGKARKIANRLSFMAYRGRSNSFGYCYWWKVA